MNNCPLPLVMIRLDSTKPQKTSNVAEHSRKQRSKKIIVVVTSVVNETFNWTEDNLKKDSSLNRFTALKTNQDKYNLFERVCQSVSLATLYQKTLLLSLVLLHLRSAYQLHFCVFWLTTAESIDWPTRKFERRKGFLALRQNTERRKIEPAKVKNVSWEMIGCLTRKK